MKKKTKFRKLTKKEKIQIWGEVENQGLGYWCQNYGSNFKGTEFEKVVASVKKGLDILDSEIISYEELIVD